MPITSTLNSAQTVAVPVSESEVIDITVNRDGFCKSNHNANIVKQDGGLNWAPAG